MSPEVRKRKFIAEEVTHKLLTSRGFKKQKANWRRRFPEIFQQFSLWHAPNGDFYRPTWGINVVSLRDEPAPVAHRLLVRWTFEELMDNAEERERCWTAFQFGSTMLEEVRRQTITSLFERWVLPCFDTFTTETAVKEMSLNPRHPLRTARLGYLPESWKCIPGSAAMPPIEMVRELILGNKNKELND